MAFRQGAYATVWETKQGNGNYTDVRITTSRKNKQNDEYETDFSGYVRFVGDAHEAAKPLKERDRIRLGECAVTNRYDKDKQITYTNYTVFGFEGVSMAGSATQATSSSGFSAAVEEDEDDELPFN